MQHDTRGPGHTPGPFYPHTTGSKRTDPEFPAGAPWTPQIPGPGHPEPRSIFTSPLSVGPKLKKNMIPSELRVPDFMKFSTASSLSHSDREPWEIDGLSSI